MSKKVVSARNSPTLSYYGCNKLLKYTSQSYRKSSGTRITLVDMFKHKIH